MIRYRPSLLVIALLATQFAGCASRPPAFEVVTPKISSPNPGKALVLFMRPRRFEAFSGGGQLPAMLYADKQFLGALPARHQLAWQADPGEYLLMVASGIPGERHGRADFLVARLRADRTYYVVIEPSMDYFGIHYRLRPQNGQIDQVRLTAWHNIMRQIRPNALGLEQAEAFSPLRQELFEAYYTEWLQKWERPTLLPESGLTSPGS